MARQHINDADPAQDEFPLSAGVGVDLAGNRDHDLANRLKRFCISYYLGPSSATGELPPTDDEDIVGPTVDIQGVSSSDAEAIGLKLSSPPTRPIALHLGTWPLSSQATKLRLVVNCVTGVANVELLAVAVINGTAVPVVPLEHVVQDDEGVASFSTYASGLDAYADVGTSSPSAQDAKPVVLEIDLGAATGVDYGRHGRDDATGECRLYLCIQSAKGETQTDGDTSVAVFEGGRRVNFDDVTFASLGVNPGPLHRWLKLSNPSDSGIAGDTGVSWPRWRGVVQVRPTDVTDVANSDVTYVLHPPIDRRDRYDGHAVGVDEYSCGIIRIHTISIQELSS